MTVHVYFEPDLRELPKKQLEISYRGFSIRKTPEHTLYNIVAPNGKRLHKSLDGSFTGIEVCERHIDSFLGQYSAADAFLEPEPKPRGRGQPRKEERNKTDENN
jgi:hypothetical protein